MIIGVKTLSHCQGKGSLSHNNRDFKPKNVDSGRTKNNVTFIKEPIGKAYEKLFGAAVERYNAKQKRSDRKIKNGYFEYQFNHAVSNSVITSPDKRKSFYEDVVQIGTKDDTVLEKLYNTVYDIAEYACKKLKIDVDKAIQKRSDGYRATYIFGDEKKRSL